MKKVGETVFQCWFKSNPDAVFIMDYQGMIIEANNQVIRQFGISNKKLNHLSFFDLFIWPETNSGLNTAKDENLVLIEGIHQIRKKDDYPLEITVSSVVCENRKFLLCFCRDIVARNRQDEVTAERLTPLKQHKAEKALRESEEKYRLIAENTADTITVLDLDLNITYVSPSIQKLRGYPAEEAVVHKMDQIFTPASLMQMKKAFTHQMDLEKSGEANPYRTVSLELEEYCKDGSTIWVEIAVSFLRDDTLKPTGILTITRDITKRKQAEEALAAREMELRNLAESSPGLMGTFYLRPDGSVCMPYTSPQIQNLYGLLSEDVVDDATSLLGRTHPDDIKLLNESIAESARTMTPWNYEFRVLHPTRGELWLEGSTNPKPHPEGGIIWYGFIHDITKRKRAEEALWESSQKLRLVLNNMPSFVFWKDLNSTYLGCNILFAKNAGLDSPEDIIGKTDLDLPWKFTEAESYRADDRSVMDTGIPKLNYEETQFTADGRNTWVRTSKVPLRNVEGDVIGILGTFEDITERKRVENELHESNTLLRAVIESAPTAIFDLDLEGNVKTVWNPAAEKMLGWNEQDVIGKLLPTITKEKEEEFRQFRDQIRSGNTLNGIEVSRQKRDGSPIDYCIYASPLFDSKGIVTGNVVVLTDITERKRADREIAHMNRSLRMLSNSNQVLIHTLDEAELYNEICRNIVEVGGYPMAWVGLVEHDKHKTLRPVAYAGFDSGYLESANHSWADDEYGRGPAGTAIRTGKPCIMHNIQTDPDFAPWRDASIQRGYKSKIALPLVNEGQTIGALGIYANEMDVFNEKEVEILMELADDLAFGISSLRSRERKKQAEEALRDSEERFSAVFHFSPLAIMIFHADNGRIVDVNDVFVNISGYNHEELIGHTTEELGIYLNPTDRDLVLQVLQEKGRVESFEFDARSKSGEVKTIICAITFIVIKSEKHYLAVILDITERKKSEERLRLLGTALEAAANSILITDSDSKIIWANDAFSRLSGYTLDEAIGNKPRDLVYSGIHSRDFYHHMWATILSGNVWHGEIINKRKNGTIFNEFLTITPVRNENNEIRHFIAVKQDITEQKKVEEELLNAKEKAEESNRLKSAFLATMNHELRTPLNHILGFSDLMRSGAIHENIADYADLIHKSSQNLLEIIEGIFELALAEQSEIKLRLQTFKCLDLFISNKSVLTEILEISGKKDHIELLFNADKEVLLLNITTDKNKINQVLINLFKNAVKFTQSGKIEFGLKTEQPGLLTFYVEDTGIGIPKNKHEIIFEFFRQADDSYTREYGGVGIGLAISKKIAEVMKGSLSLESTPDKGSKFFFKIPVSITDYQSSPFKDVNKIITIPNLQGKKILIAEDDPVSIDLIRVFLSKTGVEIIETPNGKEAIENLNINPDIILMDLNMPIMDGYTATRILKSRRPDIPIIAITAYALSTDKTRAIEAGCDGIISKPVDQSILFGELKKHLLTDQSK